ncbi:MAG: rod shape-determining protein MreC [Chlorobium sp.]|nr:MAG: rod shape-determining protein MreC [Chlorobium sp.]
MPKFFTLFFKYNNYLLFVVYCSISLLFIKLQNDDTLENLRTGSIEFSAAVNEKLTNIMYLFNLDKENERLMRVNTDLLTRVLNLETTAADERNRSKILTDSTFNASGFIMARVVDRKFSDRENMLLINAGWKNGIKKDMTVLVPEGLVGRIIAVSEHYAKIMPVINTDFKVSVVSDSSNTMGILSWNGGQESIAQIEHVPISSPLKLNEHMVTSDFSTFSTRGIPVGRVVRITPDKLFYTIDLRLAVDFSSLTQVLIAPLKIEPEKAAIANESTLLEQLP